jgi:hypothetical protein
MRVWEDRFPRRLIIGSLGKSLSGGRMTSLSKNARVAGLLYVVASVVGVATRKFQPKTRGTGARELDSRRIRS